MPHGKVEKIFLRDTPKSVKLAQNIMKIGVKIAFLFPGFPDLIPGKLFPANTPGIPGKSRPGKKP